MEAPQWWPLITACMTITHCLVLVDQVACNQIDPSPQDIPSRLVLPCHKISVSCIDFAFSLYRQLALDTPGENFLFSPASTNLALAKLSLGAPITSRAQLLESLGFNLTLVSEAEIQESFRDLLLRLPVQVPQFLLTTGQHRFSGLGATQDLGEAQKHIAAYIEKQTWGRLGAWGQDLRNETTVVLVNHMLLRARWAQPFDPSATRLREFFVNEHRAVQVPMVKQKAHHCFLQDPELQCSVLQMDHTANTTTFFVFPDRGKLGQLEGALLHETLIKWDGLLGTR